MTNINFAYQPLTYLTAVPFNIESQNDVLDIWANISRSVKTTFVIFRPFSRGTKKGINCRRNLTIISVTLLVMQGCKGDPSLAAQEHGVEVTQTRLKSDAGRLTPKRPEDEPQAARDPIFE